MPEAVVRRGWVILSLLFEMTNLMKRILDTDQQKIKLIDFMKAIGVS